MLLGIFTFLAQSERFINCCVFPVIMERIVHLGVLSNLRGGWHLVPGVNLNVVLLGKFPDPVKSIFGLQTTVVADSFDKLSIFFCLCFLVCSFFFLRVFLSEEANQVVRHFSIANNVLYRAPDFPKVSFRLRTRGVVDGVYNLHVLDFTDLDIRAKDLLNCDFGLSKEVVLLSNGGPSAPLSFLHNRMLALLAHSWW